LKITVAHLKYFHKHPIDSKVYGDRKSILVKEQASSPYKSTGMHLLPSN